MYFNYHSKLKQVINDNRVIKIEIVDDYNGISPCMLLHFENHKPMPVREHKWDEYIAFLMDLPTKNTKK